MTEYEKGEKEPLNHGVKIWAKIKRGTDTRDQDEILIEARGEDAMEAAREFQAAMDTAESRQWDQQLRGMQPASVKEVGRDD